MDYKEYFKLNYPGINPLDYIEGYDILYDLRIKAFDTDGKVENIEACRDFSKMCDELYKQLKSYEEQIESDMAEYNGEKGFSLFYDMAQEGCDALGAMNGICELYHRFYGSILLYAKESVDRSAQTGNAQQYSDDIQNNLNKSIDVAQSLETTSSSNNDNVDTLNPDYPNDLLTARFRHLDLFQDAICKQYLYKWFDGGIDDTSKYKYVFWGKGKKTDKLLYKGKKQSLANFCKYISHEKTNPEIWDYFNKIIKNAKTESSVGIAADNSRKYVDYKSNLIKNILSWTNKTEENLTDEEKKNLK